MGKALHDASEAARSVYARADQALGFSISKLCFEGPEEELLLTKNTQPAIVATSLAALAALREAVPKLPKPVCAAGHSLGEYSALVASGAMRLEDALTVVRVRGTAMQEAVPEGHGAMAAIIGSDAAGVVELCDEARQDEVLQPANFNAPGQIVVAGTHAAVDRAVELAKARGLRAIPLKVSAPFHCALMEPAKLPVREALSKVTLSVPSIPVIANVDALPNSDPSRISDLLVAQISAPVRWDDSVRRAVADGARVALEIGAGKVLAGLAKRIDKQLEVIDVGTPEGVERAAQRLAQ
jgi:[acyl-carrier-protein] S-malonyltransferase